MIGFKCAKVDDVRVLVTLDIPEDAITNINRTNVAVKETAKYRANKAKVIKIEDVDGNEYTEAITGFYHNKLLIYTIDETIEVDDYDMYLEDVCTSGIHFFLNRRVAELYENTKLLNEKFESWHENGNKKNECNYVNGELDGLFRSWRDDKQLIIQSTYVNGKLEGLYQEWDEDGNKWLRCNYVDGKLEGLFQRWFRNGNNKIKCNYVKGKREGLYQRWYDDSKKCEESNYIGGNLEGLCQEWYENGNKLKECTYVNDKLDGVYKEWNENGICDERIYVNGQIDDVKNNVCWFNIIKQ